MANELVALDVKLRDINKVNEILEETQNALPIKVEKSQEGPHLPVTEEFLAGMIAQKKRLNSRNMYIKVEENTEKKEEDHTNPNQILLREGNYQIGRLRKEWEQTITYQRQEKTSITHKNTKWMYYYIIKEEEEGKVSSVFMDDSKDSELTNFGRDEECTDYQGKKCLKNDIVVSFICLLIVVLVVWTYFKWEFIRMTIILCAACWAKYVFWIVFGAVASPWIITKSVISMVRRIKSRKITTRLFQIEPSFFPEKLISILNSKLLRLIYADNMEEIGDIVSCDIARFLRDHADVVNCEINNYWFTYLREDKDYMYLDMTYKVSLERDLEEEIGRSRETIKLQLARPLDGIMASDFYHDWSIIKIETRKK